VGVWGEVVAVGAETAFGAVAFVEKLTFLATVGCGSERWSIFVQRFVLFWMYAFIVFGWFLRRVS